MGSDFSGRVFRMILLIDKPRGITSFGVVSTVRKALSKYEEKVKVGHSGTLDPICTGVLPILIGKDTKLLPFLPSGKAYRAEILLGVETDTEDITGTILCEREVSASFDDVVFAARRFLGKIIQIPPMYSAIKVNGKKLYDFARKGIDVERKGREVTVFSLNVFPSEKKNIYELEVVCSAGTYIRTLCSDIGRELGCGACMASLRRTVSNGFKVEDAIPLEFAKRIIEDGGTSKIAISSEDVFDVEKVFLPKNGEKYYLNGGAISQDRLLLEKEYDGKYDGILKVYTSDSIFCGIGKAENGEVRPLVNYLK